MNPINHPFIKMYKIDKNDIDLTYKLINSFVIERNEIKNFEYKYFDIDEYSKTLNNNDHLKKLINNRKDKIDINRVITMELIKRNVKIDCLNYMKVKNEKRQTVLKRVDVNEFKFSIKEFEFIN